MARKVIYKTENKTVYVEDGKIVKLFSEQYPKANVLNEALNQARVEETTLKIPKVESVSKIEGKWAITMDYIEGDTLQVLMEKHPEKIDEYMDLFVSLQVEVQKNKVPLLPRLKDKMQNKISQTSFDATTRYELHMRLDAIPKHQKLCHGDFNPENVIINNQGVPYIIDWAHATQGNASCDAARTYLYFCLKGKKDLAEKYMNLFCEKTDTAKQYVQGLLPIVAATETLKGKKQEQELLAKWVNVVDYE